MKPALPAEKRRTETLLALDTATGLFVSWTQGDLATVDRFLSNFHKPLQRRMLHFSPKVALPESGVIKVKSTGEVYLISEPRDDAQNNESYDRMCVLHHVSGVSSGVVEYYNYHNEQARTDLTRGQMVKTLEGSFYVAIEYLSSKSSEYGDEAYQGKFIAYFPTNTPIKALGVFELHGVTYKVVQPYVDSSFACALLISQTDDIETFTYVGLEDNAHYDVVLGKLNLPEKLYLFSGTVDFQSMSSGGAREFSIYSKGEPLPFSADIDRFIIMPNGKRVAIKNTYIDLNAGGQTKFVCEGT